MSFVHASFLGFAALLAIPVLIHLLRSQRFDPQLIGTLRFLQQAISETSAKRKVSRWLLLLLRILAVLLIALLFARPLLHAGRGTAQETLILVDASGSMAARDGGVRRFELALRRAGRIAASQPHPRVWLCGEECREIPVAQLDQAAAKTVPAGRVDWSAALRTVGGASIAPAKLVILSDLQRADLDAATRGVMAEWPAKTRAEIVSFAGAGWDGELAALAWGRRTGAGSDLTARVVVHGTAPAVDFSVEAWHNGVCVAKVSAPPVSGLVHLAIPAFDKAAGTVEVRLIGNDPLPEDDRLWIAQSDAIPAPVVVAAPPSADRFASESYYLAKALGAEPVESTRAFDLRSTGVDGILGRDLGAVVLGDCGKAEAAALKKALPAVKSGMGALLFLGPRADAEVCASLARDGFLPAAPLCIPEQGEKTVSEWDANDPALSRYRPERGELAALRWHPRHDLRPLVAAGARAVMSFKDGTPAMVAVTCGRGRVLVVTGSPLRADGDTVIQRIFAPWLRDCVASVAGSAKHDIAWTVRDRRFTDTAGFGPLADTHEILRFPPGEGATDSADEAAFRKALHLSDKTVPAQTPQGDLPPGAARENEPWPWILLALLAILLGELMLADWKKN